MGREFGLGVAEAVTRYRVPRDGWVGTMVALVCCAVFPAFTGIMALAFTFGGDLVPGAVFGALTVPGVALCRFYARRAGSQQGTAWLFRYRDGIIQASSDEFEPRVLRWAEVAGVTVRFGTTDADGRYLGMAAHRLDDGTGSRAVEMYLPGGYPSRHGTQDAAISARITQSLISRYESGEPVTMGAWRIDQAGMTGSKAVHIPWGEVRQITATSRIHRGRTEPSNKVEVSYARAGQRRSQWDELSLDRVRNGIFLPRLLQRIAAREGFPLREVAH